MPSTPRENLRYVPSWLIIDRFIVINSKYILKEKTVISGMTAIDVQRLKSCCCYKCY